MWTGFIWIVIGHNGGPFLAVIMNFVAVREGGKDLLTNRAIIKFT